MNSKNIRKGYQNASVQGINLSNKIVVDRVLAPTLGPGNDTDGIVVLKRKAEYKRPAMLGRT
ncbi:hypothetical protein [Paenibacillus tengchongensis]|uniref:hypothetical protein n=1 Tax=Paenibacillus tengchongensis TaxID=2608684 RepID=UPI00124C8DF1|nr:hypothetical protein [Paenibacillus tengchongensis]